MSKMFCLYLYIYLIYQKIGRIRGIQYIYPLLKLSGCDMEKTNEASKKNDFIVTKAILGEIPCQTEKKPMRLGKPQKKDLTTPPPPPPPPPKYSAGVGYRPEV